MPIEILSHTADTGLEATADSLAGLIEELANGMSALVAKVDADDAAGHVEFELSATTPEDLLVDTLSELLYHAEVEDVLFCNVRVRQDTSELTVSVSAAGVPVSSTETSGPPIKAVTYHDLRAEPREGGWYGRVYFDV